MRWPKVLICMLGIAFFGSGCDDEESPPPPDLGSYASPTSPENLINNLQVSYRRREIEEYAKILAPEFIFKFQPVDQTEIGKEFWTHDEDSTGTRALLTTPEVAQIRIDLLNTSRDSTIDETPPADSLRVRVQTTDLQVDQTNDITWVVTDQQDMFFRKGISANGENASHWFMYEWHDLPTYGSPKFKGGGETTWGRLKNIYPTANN
jgi:hypothetical protein